MYLIRMKYGPAQKMRDTERPGTKEAKGDPMVDVTAADYALFGSLPRGIPENGNALVEVHAVADEKAAKQLRDSLIGSARSQATATDAYQARVKSRIDHQMGRAKAPPAAPVLQKPAEVQAKIDAQTELTAEERATEAERIRAAAQRDRQRVASFSKPAKKGR